MPPFDCDIHIPGAVKTQMVPLGEWPARSLVDKKTLWPWPESARQAPKAFGNPPRRCLLQAVFPGAAPDRIEVEFLPGKQFAATETSPDAELKIVPGLEEYYKKSEEGYHYVRREDALEIRLNTKRLSLSLAMRVGSQIRRWQWLEIIPVSSGELSASYVVGGHIYAGEVDRRMTIQEFADIEKTSFYQEHTLCAKAFLTVYANGYVDIQAHYANVQGYGRGDIAFGLPWIEIVSQDVKEFVSEEGEMVSSADKDLIRWQPLNDTKVFLGERGAGLGTSNEHVAPQFVDDSEKGFVRGVARTFHCAVRLEEAAHAPSRCLAAPAWYKKCAEFGLALPDEESDAFAGLSSISELAATVFLRNVHREGMSRGGIYRYLDKDPSGRYELSMDGNESSFLFRGAYMKSSGDLFHLAMEAARCVADICVDHDYFNVHYHGDNSEWSLFSLIYLRFGGLVQAWQETGDPWYLENAEAVANRWIMVNRQNQPRKNMGRDAEPVEGLLALYDATGKDHYFVEAEKIALDVARSLFEDFFWRTGFGVGPYWGINAMPGSAWNGTHLLAGLSEFLVRACPETSSHYAFLLEKSRGMIHRLIQSIREDYGGFHRTSGAFVPRRYVLPAYIANDDELLAEIVQVVRGIEDNYRQTGQAFFQAGHHCAGYLDSPHVLLSLHGKELPGFR